MGYRYPWWGFVLNTIREYPYLCKEYRPKEQSITSKFEPSPHGSEIGRPVEAIALANVEDKRFVRMMAVKNAVDVSDRDTVEIIRLVYWRRSHTLHGAANKLYISYRTARRRQREFVMTVARNLNLV